MNLGSWIVLAIVVAIVGLAIKATFFKKKSRGGCCDVGDMPADDTACRACALRADDGSCAGCDGCASIRYTLTPTIRELK